MANQTSGTNRRKLSLFSIPMVLLLRIVVSIIFYVILLFLEESGSGAYDWVAYFQVVFNFIFGILGLLAIPLTIIGIYKVLNGGDKKTTTPNKTIQSHSTISTYSNNFLSILKLSFDTISNRVKGRISVGQYWISMGRISIVNIIASILLYLILRIDVFPAIGTTIVFNILFGLFAISLIIFLMIRRLHDLGKSGWYIFFLLIPLVNIYWMFKILFQRSQIDSNIYGENPLGYQPKQNTYYWLVYIFFVLVQTIFSFGFVTLTQDIDVGSLLDNIEMFDIQDHYPENEIN